MNQRHIKGYINLLYNLSNRSPEVDAGFLDILEVFAWEKSLSAYQIYSKLKSTELKMAYKNVNKRIHGLELLNLIEKTEAVGNGINKHKAKYYRLTDYGVYQLFLNKLSGLRLRELDTIKIKKPPSSNTLIFFYNYNNCLLFESFIYPFFEKNTLFAIGNYLLWDLYNYLANCCHKIKQELEYNDYNIPIYDTIFFWNKVQKHDEKLLLHLKEQFNLHDIDSCEIEKNGYNDDTITVKTSTAPILLRYDPDREKVIAMSNVGGKFKEIEYSASKLGPDILVGMPAPDEKLLEVIVADAERQMQQLIYEFVYELSSSISDSEKSQEFSYYCKILSQDKKFMGVVEDIYKNRHEGFGKGYRLLTASST